MKHVNLLFLKIEVYALQFVRMYKLYVLLGNIKIIAVGKAIQYFWWSIIKQIFKKQVTLVLNQYNSLGYNNVDRAIALSYLTKAVAVSKTKTGIALLGKLVNKYPSLGYMCAISSLSFIFIIPQLFVGIAIGVGLYKPWSWTNYVSHPDFIDMVCDGTLTQLMKPLTF